MGIPPKEGNCTFWRRFFLPLLQIFEPCPVLWLGPTGINYHGPAHIPIDYDAAAVKSLADTINTWIAENGAIPSSFAEILDREGDIVSNDEFDKFDAVVGKVFSVHAPRF